MFKGFQSRKPACLFDHCFINTRPIKLAVVKNVEFTYPNIVADALKLLRFLKNYNYSFVNSKFRPIKLVVVKNVEFTCPNIVADALKLLRFLKNYNYSFVNSKIGSVRDINYVYGKCFRNLKIAKTILCRDAFNNLSIICMMKLFAKIINGF